MPVGECEVCGNADATCTAGTDDGTLELCVSCADVLGDSEGWRFGEPSDGPVPDDPADAGRYPMPPET